MKVAIEGFHTVEVERHPDMVEVGGSSPSFRTNKSRIHEVKASRIGAGIPPK